MTVTAMLYAFGVGLASFVSPCVLPLVPIYIAQLVGPGVLGSQARAGAGAIARDTPPASHWRPEPLLHAAAFVAGFGLAFVALGATASELGALLATQQAVLRRIGGVLLVLFGLHIAGIIRVPGLNRERRFTLRVGTPGYATSLAMGLVFAIGWTPCVGPYLASILVLAAAAHTLGIGVGLLAIYALGLGVPFLLVGAAFDRLAPVLKRLSSSLPTIERVAGLLLVALGIVVFFNWLLYLNSWFPVRV
jgi:cytochrome c-type biogenesis protein